jgi:hypothetical protein
MKTLGIETISKWIIYKNLFVTLVKVASTRNEPLDYGFIQMLIIKS